MSCIMFHLFYSFFFYQNLCFHNSFLFSFQKYFQNYLLSLVLVLTGQASVWPYNFSLFFLKMRTILPFVFLCSSHFLSSNFKSSKWRYQFHLISFYYQIIPVWSIFFSFHILKWKKKKKHEEEWKKVSLIVVFCLYPIHDSHKCANMGIDPS